MTKLPMGRICFFLCVVFLVMVDAGAQTTGVQTDDALQSRLSTLAAAHHGNLALFAEDLSADRAVALNADTPVQTASVIKLAVLYDALQQIREGRAHFDDKLTLTHGD